MKKMEITRRNTLAVAAFGAVAGMGAGGVAGCPSVDVAGVIRTVTDLITKVQAGVVAACGTATKWVPTADTVLGVIESFLGGTPLGQSNLTDGVKFVHAAIDEIARLCPAQAPTASPAPHTTAKGVPIVFY